MSTRKAARSVKSPAALPRLGDRARSAPRGGLRSVAPVAPLHLVAPHGRFDAGGSGTALVAATTLGADAAGTVRAHVRADLASSSAEANAVDADTREYRLIVQSYRAHGLSGPPDAHVRPVASVQRAVTAADLRRGVNVSLVEFDARRDPNSGADAKGARPVVVAWIEAGKPDLEYDGRKARPLPGSVYGMVKKPSLDAQVQIRLDRTLAA